MKYTPKVFLRFCLRDESIRDGWFRQSQVLGHIIAGFGGGKTKLDQSKSVGELGLKNDDVIKVR